MAVVPKHIDQNPRYDPNDDLTVDQLHRFTRAANKAQEKRDEIEERQVPSITEAARKARRAEARGEVTEHKQRSSLQYAAWMVIFAVLALCVMYLTQ